MQEVRGSTELFLGFQVGQVVGGAVASTCCLMMRRLLAIVLRKVPFINGSSNRITPRAWVSIISSSLVLAGATGANVARACSVNGPNRDTSVKLLTGWYSVTSTLPWSCRPRSVRTSRAVVPTPIGPGDVWVMEVTAGSHLKRFAPSADMIVGSPQGQTAVAQEREGQMVGVANPLDAKLGRRNDVVEGVAGEVGQLHPLEVGPQRLR